MRAPLRAPPQVLGSSARDRLRQNARAVRISRVEPRARAGPSTFEATAEVRMANATVRGRFVWHELFTPNRAGSQEFYGKVAGWAVQSWDQDPGYQMFAAKSGPIGAAVEERSGTPQWLAYIGTTDVDATTDAATRLGGRVQTAPAALPNGGRYAVLVDPQGATFGVHASATPPQPEAAAKAGEFSWHELATTAAPNVAFGFYAALFDWDLV